jgi:hypothetical protein
MIFLPIVDRELRVAARRPATFWLRVAAALTAFAVAAGIYALMQIGGMRGGAAGEPLFAVLKWMSLAAVLTAGLFFTSDALSEEKREGTLGFLFLTDLRGHDVVLGKLLATSCRCLLGLLAIFPILACTQLMGGVAGGEFWRTLLALVHTLVFSLAAGLFVSALSHHPQKALGGTVALLLLLCGGSLAFDGLVAYGNDRNFVPVFSLASPIFVFVNADSSSGPFWLALGVSQATAWALLGAACLLIPRTWQVKANRAATASPWQLWWRYGSVRQRTALRRKLLEGNPIAWLSCRERWQALVVWIVVGLAAGSLVLITYSKNQMSDLILWQVVSWLTMPFLTLWVASQASQFFAEARRAGLVELWLATPLESNRIAAGVWQGLVRSFGVPLIGLVITLAFGSIVAGLPGRMMMVADEGSWAGRVLIWGGALAGAAVTLANFTATAWFGLWMGLVSRNALTATLKTVVFVLVLPWMVINFASGMLTMLLVLGLGGFGGGGAALGMWLPAVLTGFALGLTLIKDVFFWTLARRKLVRDFRETAARAVLPVVRYVVLPRPGTPPMAAPPVIPSVRAG